MNIKFGPVGIGKLKDIEKTFKEYSELGFRCAEIPFTYGVYIKEKETAEKIKHLAEKYNLELSIHAPYWINLNSEDWEKIEASKERIIESCKVGEWLGAKVVVFHAGFFSKINREETYNNIKNRINEIQEIINNRNKWKIKLAPETMGKINVFGSVKEISLLVKETDCSFCLDFAHILARDKKIDMKKIEKLFPEKEWHAHYSGIEYGEKGEKRHIPTKDAYWEGLFEKLPKDKKIRLICEAPEPVKDAINGLQIYLSR